MVICYCGHLFIYLFILLWSFIMAATENNIIFLLWSKRDVSSVLQLEQVTLRENEDLLNNK